MALLSGNLRRSAHVPHSDDPGVTDRQSVEEAVGVFPDDASLQNAVSRLTAAGFGRSRLLTPALDTPGTASAVLTEAAKTEEDTRQLRTLRSSTTAAAAAMAGAATVVATGGAAAAAIAVAAGAGLVAGGGVFAANNAADVVTASNREAQAASGSLRLIVALSDDTERSVVEHAMRDAGASTVTIRSRAHAAFTQQAKLA